MSRSTRSKNPNSRHAQPQSQPQHLVAKVTDIKPPSWRTKWSGTADLGYPGFDPPRPGQPEDILTEQNVKQGYNYAENVPVRMNNDNFSAHGLIHSTLTPSRNRSVLSLLGDLMSAVYEVRAESAPGIPINTYKLPPRMTLNDARRNAWLAELSNPEIPLSKLARTVLHVPKGPELLDMLHAHNITTSRAVWYVRILGANETLSLKSRPNHNPAQLAVEWAGTVTSHLKKQLQDIVLPSAPRPGLAIKSTFKSTLTQADTKAKWVLRFGYCVELLRAFYLEQMVDHGAVLSWLSSQIAPANVAQLYFVLRLVEEYLDDIAQHRMFARPTIEGCLVKLVEFESSTVPESLTSLSNAIGCILQRLFLLNPDYFVCARVWAQLPYRRLLQTLFQDRVKSSLGELKSNSEIALIQDMTATFGSVAARNDGLLFRVLPERTVVDMRATIADVQLLNSIGPSTDLSSVSYFQSDGSDDQKLSVLLTWAVTPSQYGTHRPFLACSLLARRAGGARWQEGIWRWLDTSDEVRAVGAWENEREDGVPLSAGLEEGPKNAWHNRDAVALLVGELIEKGLLSYGWYMQKLIARGITDLTLSRSASSHHRTLLYVLPLSSSNVAMSVMRANTLYGGEERSEGRTVRAVCIELQPFLLELVGGVNEPWTSTTLTSLERYLSCGRYILMLVVNDWLLATVHQFLDQGGQLSGDAFARIVHLLSARKCFSSIAELIFAVLQSSCDEILGVVIAVVERYMNIWAAMDVVNEVGEELFKKHQALRSEDKPCRSLFALLSTLSSSGCLPESAHHQIESEVSFSAQSLHPPTDGTIPPAHSFPQIMTLVNEPSLKRIADIADYVWYNHHASETWATVIWEQIFSSICNVPRAIPDTQKSEIATRYVTFLVKISDHIASGLDNCLREWFSTGMNDLLSTEQAHDILALVFLRLVLAGVLAPSTILEGLVYPTWDLAAGLQEPKPAVSCLAELANDLTERLLVTDDVPSSASLLPPSTLSEVLELSARRLPASDNASFLTFINKFPCLVAMEIQPHVGDAVRESSKGLRILLVNQPQLVTLSSRYMDVVRDSFLKPTGLVLTERLELLLTSVLKGIVNGGCVGHKSSPVIDRIKHRPILTRIDPWGVTKASLDLHLTLKLLESSLEQDSSRAEAKERLADFSSSLFGRGMSSQSSDLVAGVLKGISGPVATKFVNDGLERLTKGLRSLRLNIPGSVSAFLNDSGETLRLLCRVILPLRDDPSKLPTLEPNIKDDFISAVQTSLEAVLLTWKQSDHSVEPRRLEVATLVARLNQFALGFPGFWTKGTSEKAEALIVAYIQMIKSIGHPQLGDLGLFPILLDTIGFILDEIPKPGKYPSTEALQQVIDPSRQLILPNLPKELHDRVLPLLKFIPANSCTGLALRFIQPTTRALLITHFTHRPWEWGENLDDGPAGDNVRNSASLPLELFSAEATNDRISQPDRSGPNKLWNNTEKDDWHMKTVVGSEVTFQREWLDSRILEVAEKSEDSTDEGSESDDGIASQGIPGPSRRSQGLAGQRNGPSKKRKASMSPVDDAMSDDDIQIIEGPTQSNPNQSARQ
ncbi:Med12 domain containing protein [Ceratobasidium theobromae]|uniref:Mediator of RNA polymerase II transcription subunit 12 n=1 Tax=Ceratobasidium theobromae TaxID=1582974 RepID=A0A5N5QA59_9AGAM|nr:Med12 domain containing protein [Ceratobasidium theobromae]